jgi:SNF2 family DNA or RNA helicase
LNTILTEKMIKDMCGTVSFKRGDSFYRANKVIVESYCPDNCKATVIGTEDFHVTIEWNESGDIRSKCSCPKLASFQKDCQHIAAVLVAVYEHQRKASSRLSPASESQFDSITNQGVTEGFLTLFNDHPVRVSGQLNHFDRRETVAVEVTCKPVTIGAGSHMFGIEVQLGPTKVKNIRAFLEQVKDGVPCQLSASFTYDTSMYCFEKETNEVVQELIQVIQDEKVYLGALPNQSDYVYDPQRLLIPPSAWERLFPILMRAPLVKLEYEGNTYQGLHLLNEPLPLNFDFVEGAGEGFCLKINGLNRMVVLSSYSTVLYEGKLVQMKREEIKLLSDLNQMLEGLGTNQIPIHQEQVGFFLEKVVPGLKKLGELRISDRIADQLVKAPLIAKLYLDRVNNRLLAGLEFCYENVVINPLESRKQTSGSLLIRDVKKEKAILKLMDESSFAKTDEGYFLHNEELEYEFLYNVVPKLQKLVQIYATTAVKNRIFRGNARPQIRVKFKRERTNWLEFKFEMDGIPDKQIREVLAALEEKRKYYRLRDGSLLSLEQRDFDEIKRFLNAIPVQKEDLESGLNLPIVGGLRLLDMIDDPTTFKLEESFRQFLESITNPDNMAFEIPKSLDPIIRDYQKNGFKWMKTLASYGFGGILADDMGLGKTLQSITFILSELPNIRDRKLPVLIVCPSSLTYNWLNEIKKFAPEVKALVVDGNKAKRINLMKNLIEKDVLITSYPLLLSDSKWYEKQTFQTVFFDEAQAFKNPITKTAKAVKKIQAENRFALTGTPIENSLEELWSIFHVVFPELFQGLKEFSFLSRKTVARRIRPFLLRRLKEDVLSELPEKIESMESVELLPDQKKLYAAYLAKLRHDTLKRLDKDTLRKNRIKILAGLTRLRQICCHPALFVDGYKGSSAKFEQLMQIVEEARLSGRRVLIFSQFTKMLEIIGRELALLGLTFFYLNGQTPSEERVEICDQFNAGERDLFLISLKAGGTGLNLTGADTVILYDIWWNPAVEQQAADRAHRIGQTNPVQVIKLVARGTIEEKMNELQEKKRHLIEEIIDSEEKTSTTLTEEDIREILMI